jgi:excisionase family DNA binding protein
MASEREDIDQLEQRPFEAIECDGDTRKTRSSSVSTRARAGRAARQRPGPQSTEQVQTPDSGPRIVPATANDDERLWSIAEVADYLGVSKETIYGWRKSGYGPPASKVGKHLRWRPVDVTDWIDRLRQTEPFAVTERSAPEKRPKRPERHTFAVRHSIAVFEAEEVGTNDADQVR